MYFDIEKVMHKIGFKGFGNHTIKRCQSPFLMVSVTY